MVLFCLLSKSQKVTKDHEQTWVANGLFLSFLGCPDGGKLYEVIVNQREDIAKTTDRSKSHLSREAIKQYAAEYADYQIAQDKLDDLHDEIISSGEMWESLANEG